MEKRVYIKTYGCQMNERESEGLAATLRNHGYEITDDEHSAEIILLNTCSVREQAEAKAIGKSNFISRGKNQGKLVGILGCMAQNFGETLYQKSPNTRLVVGPDGLGRIPEYLDRLMGDKNRRITDIEVRPLDRKFTSARDEKKVKASLFVSIMRGCNMRCTYCIVPKTRGSEQYRPMEDIIREIQWLAERGTREVTLLGQIVNNYGTHQIPFIGGKSPFVQLLEKIQAIEGIRRIRFMSPHPKGFKSDLIDAYENLPKLCPHVHLPLQSGSDRILKAMKRPYKREQFSSIVAALGEKIPTISISTDIIVGFPGENEEDFEATCAVFDEIKFDMAFIFKYSPRPGTIAENFGDQISQEIKEARNQILLKKVEYYSRQYNESMVGTVKEILVERRARRGLQQFEGYTPEHRKVIFTATEDLIGQLISVKIEGCTTSTLLGKFIPSQVAGEA
ncbi:MAG: tRNA (N6-isopentenyl adenosine(37)-C2)-methylthiotransferase MiaB [Puniceicoccales bacterium]|jgi:tRNA-2-methylthio-N6-dimethylallyladenosine synthase|nr:tRNA (N6-isopentenyl adenosine(37)-C2)-methylthiotransferase MiaB [Puniceicoccales bacterium]